MKNLTRFILFCSLLLLCINDCLSRNHNVRIKNDKRKFIMISQFGYYPRGYLLFNISKFDVTEDAKHSYGFTLDHSSNSGVASYVESSNSECMLYENKFPSDKLSAVIFNYSGKNKTFTIKKYGAKNNGINGILFYSGSEFISKYLNETQTSAKINITVKRQDISQTLKTIFEKYAVRNSTELADYIYKKLEKTISVPSFEKWAIYYLTKSPDPNTSNTNLNSNLKILVQIMQRHTKSSSPMAQLLKELMDKLNVDLIVNAKYPLSLLVLFPTVKEEGAYDLYFHNCKSKPSDTRLPVNMKMSLVEKNWNSYLGAGEQPLPLLFFILCSGYVILTVIWTITLRTSEHNVFKIHYLMLVLLIMKALTLFFHGINYYELGRNGVEEQGWAIMYYITHLLKGALLFTTIVLIGAGWAFIKHMLSSKEKKIFAIILPLQILANVAAIIINETEESAARYLTWRNIFLLVDLICCGAILFPVIWSIKHLKEAANIDGKQQLNLHKLKLFRHFYILIICYIYFTRIIVYLLIVTLSFKLIWTVDLFRECSILVFMIITGYKFRPVSNNPYLLVPDDEDDDEDKDDRDRIEMEHAWSQSGITDGLVKLKHNSQGLINQTLDESDDDNDVEGNGGIVHFDRKQHDPSQSPNIHTSRL